MTAASPDPRPDPKPESPVEPNHDTNHDTNHGHERMRRAVHLRQQRRARWSEEGERSIWQNMSMIGALGWLIVVPTLLGVLAGRWLDDMFASGIFWTGALIVLGVGIGSYLAWQRINKE
jgi:ATP synthase protein I